MTLRSVLMGATALVGVALPQSAWAQAAAADQGDIVVTARQRSEKLQDVPVSVTAFTAKNLEDAGVKRVEDFIHLTPNITMVNSQSPGTSFITIRGLTQNRNQPAPVAIVVDGVLQTSDRQFAAGLLDLDSIQVVRGPQGALYGRNATGGAIIVNTKAPTNTTEGHLESGVGNGGDYYGEASLSGPIIDDKLTARVSTRIQQREGYFDNIALNQKADPFKDYILQGRLMYTPTSNLTFDAKAYFNKTHASALNITYQPANLAADGISVDPANPYDSSKIDANRVDREFYPNNLGRSIKTVSSFSLRTVYNMDFATLSAVSAYDSVTEGFAADALPYTAARDVVIGGGVADGAQSQYTTSKALSQEIRLTSPSNGRFRWMFGGYIVKTNRFISTTGSLDEGNGIILLKRTPQFDNPRNPTTSFLADNNHNLAWAFFGNAEYDLTRKLEVGVALRYDYDHRKQFVSPYNTAGTPGLENTANFHKLQPKVTVKYKPVSNIQLYTSWGQGFRSGQFNQNGVGAVATEIGLDGVQDVAKQEETSSFEVGFKSSWLGGHLTLDADYFHTIAKNVQYFVYVGSINAQVLVNIDRVRLDGGEVEAALHLGRLSATAGLGITQSKIEKYGLVPGDVGNKAPFVPNMTFQPGLQYTATIGSDFSLTGRVDYEMRGKQYWSPENETARKALNLVNLRLTLVKEGGRWELAGFVHNVGDVRYNEEYGSGGFAYAANPRTYGASLRYNF